ncbi:MAG TPA: phosphoribosyltransferase family protein [Acidimicrobiia bacterium]
MAERLHDRRDAGRRLASRLAANRHGRPVVLGLPRGGIPVAYEVARALDAPLDVLIVRKLGLPAQPELAMGAIGEGGTEVLNPDVVSAARVTEAELRRVEERERVELERRARTYRGSRPQLELRDREVIIVDDGLATGATARAAVRVVRELGARRVVLAVPVAPAETARQLSDEADEVIALWTPRDFRALGEWYDDFGQTSDREVTELLDRAASSDRAADAGAPVVGDRPPVDTEVTIQARAAELPGHLTVPVTSHGIVLFAHGSGSGRHSPRNVAVAETLHRAGFGTLLFDLLTDHEARDRANVFDVELLAGRLGDATAWLRSRPGCGDFRIGYFGASTGAAAALLAAAQLPNDVDAVVSRGGRPDLAGARLADVRAPTLLIVGELDREVLALNRDAARRLRSEHAIEIVPGATHLFEEPGTLARAAELAIAWFRRHLA